MLVYILILITLLVIFIIKISHSDVKQRIPNINYINLVQEYYNKEPNINSMLFYLKQLCKIDKLDDFYILDSIRLLSKSFRSQKFSIFLTKKDGDITTYYDQMAIYRNEIIDGNKKFRISNICEIGFQVGAGCLTFLTSLKHNIRYYGFDYGLIHSKYSYKIISNYFDLNMTWGNSKYTVPNQKIILCNVIHIDGDHNLISIYNDIINMKRFSNKNSIVFLDDVNYKHNAIIKAKNEKIITSINCFNWKPFCICKYNI